MNKLSSRGTAAIAGGRQPRHRAPQFETPRKGLCLILLAALWLPGISLRSAPLILTQPQSETVPAGNTVNFSVTATNQASLPAVSSGTLQLWLRADAGVVTNVAGLVSQWQDQSGHNHNAAQTNAILQPA